MTTRKLFNYKGVNGTIVSAILLEGVEHTIWYELIADEGHLLTDGILRQQKVMVQAKDVENWTEVEDFGQN